MTTSLEDVLGRLSTRVLDVRQTLVRSKASGTSMRFMDQKVTPDMLQSSARIALEMTQQQDEFTVGEIWSHARFKQTFEQAYGKPPVDESTASSEYDKVISQPMKALAWAGVLDERRVKKNTSFSVCDASSLAYIAASEEDAYLFTIVYLEECLRQSGQLAAFQRYKDSGHTPEDFQDLKRKFISFMLAHTRIRGEVEVRRIFPKVLNPLAAAWFIPGARRGRVAKFPQLRSDLTYNSQNWRDLGKKSKHTTRTQAGGQLKQLVDDSSAAASKVMNKVRVRHAPHSEVLDVLAQGEATQVHHIVPRSRSKALESVPENLILLTASQHSQRAHPSNNTGLVDPSYQLDCLLAKSISIQASIDAGDEFYSVNRFRSVIEEVVGTELNGDVSLAELRQRVLDHRLTIQTPV